MPGIVRRLPFFPYETHVLIAGRRIRIRSDQIVVWISITPEATAGWSPQVPRFPAILDIGCNHNLVVRADQLLEFAGLSAASLEEFRRVRVQGRRGIELRANLWLHRNRPGQRDAFARRDPHLLETNEGIVVLERAADDGFPRLPLLGLRALRWARLQLHIDCRRCRVGIRTSWWPGLFG